MIHLELGDARIFVWPGVSGGRWTRSAIKRKRSR